ncbi:hypothetical protein M0R72_14980 [Candidatus Pacearchaeota archaeon]|jgi:hypothetical protein|nr:hypothetical protein [Candidatus Pacearchaeota archaeon]
MSLRGRRHDGGGGQNELIFFYTSDASASFDPTITTSISTDVYWAPDDGPVTKTTGTTHAFSYTPGAGSHRCKVTVASGLPLISAWDINSDALTGIINARKAKLNGILYMYLNTSLKVDLREFPNAYWIDFGCISPARGIVGNPESLSPTIQILYLAYTGVTGSMQDFPASIQFLRIDHTAITASSISHLVDINDIRMFDMSWTSDDMDVVLDSVYLARANYTNANPKMQILTGNATPSGNYAAPPVDESSNSDWIYDAGVGHHWSLTGNAKRWYLVHGPDRGTSDVFNRWQIT